MVSEMRSQIRRRRESDGPLVPPDCAVCGLQDCDVLVSLQGDKVYLDMGDDAILELSRDEAYKLAEIVTSMLDDD